MKVSLKCLRRFPFQRSTGTEDAGLTDAVSACSLAGIEVVLVLLGWIELRVPGDLAVISPLQEWLARSICGET